MAVGPQYINKHSDGCLFQVQLDLTGSNRSPKKARSCNRITLLACSLLASLASPCLHLKQPPFHLLTINRLTQLTALSIKTIKYLWHFTLDHGRDLIRLVRWVFLVFLFNSLVPTWLFLPSENNNVNIFPPPPLISVFIIKMK
jgi:hypothetical protein